MVYNPMPYELRVENMVSERRAVATYVVSLFWSLVTFGDLWLSQKSAGVSYVRQRDSSNGDGGAGCTTCHK